MAQEQVNGITAFELGKRLEEVEPAVLLLPQRLIRRVIRADCELTGLLSSVPHRKTYNISREALLHHIDPEELNLPVDYQLPEQLVLMVRPKSEKLATMSTQQVLGEYWQLLFHAHVDRHMQQLQIGGALNPEVAADRIDAIGQAAFDAIRDVLKKERFLLPPLSGQRVYSEFVAVYFTLLHFYPDARKWYFPAIQDFDAIEKILRQDVDDRALLEASRPDDASVSSSVSISSTSSTSSASSEAVHDEPASAMGAVSIGADETPEVREKIYHRLTRKAERAVELGNLVRAAILQSKAAGASEDDAHRDAVGATRNYMEQLAGRLQEALLLRDADLPSLVEAMIGLIDRLGQGFRSPGLRVLYDLQRTCIDHERMVYKLDLVSWVTSRGKVPLKRRLPNRQLVRMHQYVCRALTRLQRARGVAGSRDVIDRIIRPATVVLEAKLRDQFRPLILEVFTDVGPEPSSPPEQVARDKLIEELLDRIVDRGFVNMGDLRDAMSRNALKISDVNVGKFFKGDELLRVDRGLAGKLDGVYQRGEMYRRWPQRFSSLAFGTRVGRFITSYLIVPFLGAYVVLTGLQPIVQMIPGIDDSIQLNTLTSVAITGTILLWLLHAADMRRALFRLAKWGIKRFYGIVIEWPAELLKLKWVQQIVHNRGVRVAYRYAFKPAAFGSLFLYLLSSWGVETSISRLAALGLFFVVNLLLNTRLGRNMEEFGHDLFTRMWRQVIWRGVYSFGLWIMQVFAQLLDVVDRALYNVDEWLRFRSGETRFTFVAKLMVGTAWFYVSYFATFCVTLLIEPQVNPIKHFPVVTVSHKIVLGFFQVFVDLLEPVMGDFATPFVGTVIWVIPGIFGYLVWELKENWRLYEASRPAVLKPAIIGSHGETMLRLLKPGFHSGTVPKIYSKLRKLERKRGWSNISSKQRKQLIALHHVQESVEQFFERELIAMLEISERFGGMKIHVAGVHLGGNSIRATLRCEGQDSLVVICFEEQSGWLVATVEQIGWLAALSDQQREVFATTLAGFYKHAAVDLVREQIEQSLDIGQRAYDIESRGIVIWPLVDGADCTVIELNRDGIRDVVAQTAGADVKDEASVAAEAQVHVADRDKTMGNGLDEMGSNIYLFRSDAITWKHWARLWRRDRDGLAPSVPVEMGPALLSDG